MRAEWTKKEQENWRLRKSRDKSRRVFILRRARQMNMPGLYAPSVPAIRNSTARDCRFAGDRV